MSGAIFHKKDFFYTFGDKNLFLIFPSKKTLKTLILNAKLVNENKIIETDILIEDNFIQKIDKNLSHIEAQKIIDAQGKHIFAGVIDDQVHFREPGLTHKANIHTESKSAIAGGTTTFMEMPNTVPNALTQSLLEDKYDIAKKTSWANYSFFMGVSNDNHEEALKTDPKNVCGLKIFMGSSTGNMLVDNPSTLEKIFSESPLLIATHCEDEKTIRQNIEFYKETFSKVVPTADIHPVLRDEDACLLSSQFAKNLAKKHNTRLHILHISTQNELFLFENKTPRHKKRITSEVCVHHLHFTSDDYAKLNNQIKCNPAIKNPHHKEALWKALLNDTLDIIATDHAPHTWEEKQQDYWQAPSGVPLVQHSLLLMLEYYKKGKISLEKIIDKMCHAPADIFQINKRGYVREGYFADLVMVDLEKNTNVTTESLHYKCGWSPFVGESFSSQVTHTFVNGKLVYENGVFADFEPFGQRLTFDR